MGKCPFLGSAHHQVCGCSFCYLLLICQAINVPFGANMSHSVACYEKNIKIKHTTSTLSHTMQTYFYEKKKKHTEKERDRSTQANDCHINIRNFSQYK